MLRNPAVRGELQQRSPRPRRGLWRDGLPAGLFRRTRWRWSRAQAQPSSRCSCSCSETLQRARGALLDAEREKARLQNELAALAKEKADLGQRAQKAEATLSRASEVLQTQQSVLEKALLREREAVQRAYILELRMRQASGADRGQLTKAGPRQRSCLQLRRAGIALLLGRRPVLCWVGVALRPGLATIGPAEGGLSRVGRGKVGWLR